MFLSLSGVVLISLALFGMLMYRSFSDNLKDNTKQVVLDSLHHADETVNVFFDDIDHISSVIVTNKPNVIDELQSPNFEISYDWFLENKQSEEFLESLMAYKSYIKRIAIVGMNGKIIYTGSPYLDKSFVNGKLVSTIAANEGRKVLIKQSSKETGQGETVTLGRAIRYDQQTIGVVMIDIDFGVIQHAYDINPAQGSYLYVIDGNGQFIYRTDPQLTVENVKGTLLEPLYRRALQATYTEGASIRGVSYQIVSYRSAATGWSTIAAIPERKLVKGSAKLLTQLVEVSLLVFFIVLFVSVAVSSQITKNLKRLRNTMLWVHQGNMTLPTKITSRDEVGELKTVFENMITRIKQLIEDNQLQASQKREAELTALQAQIRPHFLYNTLNTIKYLANIRQAGNIAEVTGSLIDLLRGVLGNTREFVKLEEELDYVRSYMTIQTYKYLNQFTYSIQAEPDILQCAILKLLLQPIVENALLHGIGHMQQGGVVSIRAYRSDGYMKLDVRDNGIGMTQEQIDAVMRHRAPAEGKGFSGLGIRNIHERIRLVYGEGYGIEIFSQPSLYTSVEITLPIRGTGGDAHV